MPPSLVRVTAYGGLVLLGICLLAASAALLLLMLVAVGLPMLQADGDPPSAGSFVAHFEWLLADVLRTSMTPGQALFRISLPGIVGILLIVAGARRATRGRREGA